ncbi:MAG: ABC transporter ATP-binding protein [Proteobacteria bacterium]|nr:ABC transporter ATP-binding protein [Pseudomonadota bacterium]
MSVVVSNLTKAYAKGGALAVENVSFAAPPGAITALLGPSGAGKSTVLRMIAGLEVADGGSIAIEGQDVSGLPVRRRGVGFVFQSYALFDHLSVRRNIGFGLELRRLGRRAIDARVEELLSMVRLEGLGARYPAQLSGGQRQRVAFARALAVRPRVLLLDEPFGALDARVRHELRQWLHELHHETGLTTLMVTHDQGEALELAEHVVVMFDGRVAQAASPAAIYDEPATPQVAAFVGGANVLSGTVRDGRVEAGTVALRVPEGAQEGDAVHAVVRPHDVKVARLASGAGQVIEARVARLRRVGGQVKLQLTLDGGAQLLVEMPTPQVLALSISEGDHVFVDLQSSRVFVGDYAI